MGPSDQHTWRDIVTRLKQERQEAKSEGRELDVKITAYKCKACQSWLLDVTEGRTLRECPQCGKHALELQSDLIAKAERRVQAMKLVDQAVRRVRHGDPNGARRLLESAVE